uniref:Ninjurin 2 n=1 Tax=Neogobius melanostomus TaxID=47308 RepID=A0A8C6UL50_9GOBI
MKQFHVYPIVYLEYIKKYNFTQPTRRKNAGSPFTLNMNQYATKKTAAEGMLDIALFLANITHMKTVIEQGAGYRYYAAVLTLISFSLALQMVAGVLIVIIGRRNLNNSSLQKRLDYLNNVTTAIVFVTTGLNFFISTFGMQRTGHFPWLMIRIH